MRGESTESRRSPEAGADASAATDGEGIADALFAPARLGRLDGESVSAGVQALLARHPDARVMAMRADGVCVPMPAVVGLRENPVLQARSGLDIIAPRDRLRVLATWDALLARGAARCVAHLVDAPEQPVTMYFFDLRESDGVLFAAYVPSQQDDAQRCARELAGPAAESKPATPRFAKVVKDQLSVITDVDEALTQILGWSAAEMIGRRSIEFIHPDDHALAIDNWMEMLSAPGLARRVRLRHRRRDGAWVWFEVTNHNFLDDPTRTSVFCELVDISEEMAAAEEVRARKELLDRIAEAIPMGLLQVDAAGGVVYTNDRLHEILGVGPAASAEEQFACLLEDDRGRLMAALEDLLAHGRAADLEVRLCASGERKPRLCAINVRALSDGEGATAGAIACIADITESARMREELTRRATFDELTECYNRAAITRLLESVVEEDPPVGCCAALFVDVDRFKGVNDELGHAAGDELLRVLAGRLRHAVRGGDHVGRLGGDEFLVVCPQVDSEELAATLAERVRRTLGEPVSLAAGPLVPSVSVGVAWSAGEATSASELIARADSSMYDDKHEHGHERAAARNGG